MQSCLPLEAALSWVDLVEEAAVVEDGEVLCVERLVLEAVLVDQALSC